MAWERLQRGLWIGVAGVLICAAGCEKKVVAVHHGFNEQPQPQAVEQPAERRGPLESLGDFLFGWMKPKQERKQAEDIPGYDPFETVRDQDDASGRR